MGGDANFETVLNIDNDLQYDAEVDVICSICNAEFLDPGDLKQHLKVHSTVSTDTERRKTCDFCECKYADVEEYAYHIRDSHLAASKFCQLCSRVFIDFNKYKQHTRKHYTAKSEYNACSQCSALYINEMELERHEVENHKHVDEGVFLHNLYPFLSSVLNMKMSTFTKVKADDSDYSCTVCDYKTNDLDLYIQHLQEKNCRSLACDSCGNVYKLRRGLFSHLVMSSSCNHVQTDKTIQCKECYQLIGSMYYKNHIRQCKPVKCTMCNIIFHSVNDLTEHQISRHPLSIEVKTCKFCYRQCVGKVALMKHMTRVHRTELHLYKYECVDCKTVFKHPQKLFSHFYMKHKDLEPYTCKICNKKFKIRKKFTIHIKLDHNSVGFIEFDKNYHVYFADKKSENPFTPTCVLSEEDKRMCNMYSEVYSLPNQKSDASDYKSILNVLSATETECYMTELEKKMKETQPKKQKRRRKTGGRRKKTVEKEYVIQDSTDEDDIPLVELTNSKPTPKAFPEKLFSNYKDKKDNRRKVTCTKCNKYCYTKQNYKRHMALHSKNELQTCIKCAQIFNSVSKLKEHVEKEHSTSQLIDTLKMLLEKRKQGRTSTHELTMSQKFEQTIKRVKTDTTCTPAKITVVKDGTSVQKFLENFSPEDSKKTIVIESNISIKPVTSPFYREPFITMKKFTPEPLNAEVKLAMPVKFKPDLSEKVKVKVQLVQSLLKPSVFSGLECNEKIEGTDDHNYTEFDSTYYEESKECIPEVAQEEEVENHDERKHTIHVPHKIVIPKLPANHNISIAHLLPEAPYYRIVKVNDVLNDVMPEPPKKPVEKPTRQDLIKLPDGTKLVTVNPLAHLLGDKKVDDIMQPLKSKYYKPKVISNVENAFTKALEKANTPTHFRKASDKVVKRGRKRKLM
ncbi:gastrula zinc finger protein xFG20-1-like [Bombyx mandarina]|uniref:C2H2-type domain-containing protein n=2 Tax=Bombyx TaxID=7090 RepID=A0A8R1WEJ1_BOMMO|nr:gastrula zinc finger protein xFG20-1 [Bombyx mori]XP_028038333.1 gastrula zinc finger protein xFG20-1-like [Bombyx mandarina]